MQGLVQLLRKGEPIKEYNFAYSRGFMRAFGWTKGFCTECGKWKLFHIDYVDMHVERTWIIARPDPFVFHAGSDFYGTCTNGHSGIFRPWTRPEQKQWKRSAGGSDWNPSDRDELTKHAYLWWRESFRKPEREAHYQHDHECDSSCPEYEWDYEEW